MSALKKMLDKYRGLDKVALRVGIMGGKTYPDGTSVAAVGAVNEYGTESIPARPFLRRTVSENRKKIPKIVAKNISKIGSEQTIRLLGEYLVDEIVEAVQTWEVPPNAASTIAAKGYNAPLRANDKLLRNSFSYEIEEK